MLLIFTQIIGNVGRDSTRVKLVPDRADSLFSQEFSMYSNNYTISTANMLRCHYINLKNFVPISLWTIIPPALNQKSCMMMMGADSEIQIQGVNLIFHLFAVS